MRKTFRQCPWFQCSAGKPRCSHTCVHAFVLKSPDLQNHILTGKGIFVCFVLGKPCVLWVPWSSSSQETSTDLCWSLDCQSQQTSVFCSPTFWRHSGSILRTKGQLRQKCRFCFLRVTQTTLKNQAEQFTHSASPKNNCTAKTILCPKFADF